MMKLVLLLALLSVSEGGSSSVIGRTGQSVTLSCKYDTKDYGQQSICWVRGDIPHTGCSNVLISTGDYNVTAGTRASSRYQLLGRLDEGDVSLTILNVTEADAGRYGCRVEIPGWFNDEIHHFDLVVERAAPTTPSPTPTRETTTETTTASVSTTGQLTATGTVLTSSSGGVQAEQENGGVLMVVLVCVLFGLVALVTAGGLVIIARRWRRLNKMPQQQQVHFSSTMQLQNRGSAVENIYQIDGGGDGGEYEYCP